LKLGIHRPYFGFQVGIAAGADGFSLGKPVDCLRDLLGGLGGRYRLGHHAHDVPLELILPDGVLLALARALL